MTFKSSILKILLYSCFLLSFAIVFHCSIEFSAHITFFLLALLPLLRFLFFHLDICRNIDVFRIVSNNSMLHYLLHYQCYIICDFFFSWFCQTWHSGRVSNALIHLKEAGVAIFFSFILKIPKKILEYMKRFSLKALIENYFEMMMNKKTEYQNFNTMQKLIYEGYNVML